MQYIVSSYTETEKSHGFHSCEYNSLSGMFRQEASFNSDFGRNCTTADALHFMRFPGYPDEQKTDNVQ